MNFLQKATPRAEFPYSSSLGANVATPITLGITKKTAPDTPDLAGKPTVNANSPE